jgi:hypothetical protein
MFKPVPESEIPEKLRRLQFVRFDLGRALTRSIGELAAALQVDLDWIRDHTRLGGLSERWQIRKRDVALLLRGDELEDAERWLARKPPGAPEPTELLRAFLTESRRAEAARLDKERQQLAEREEALANIAAEQAQRAQSQRISWGTCSDRRRDCRISAVGQGTTTSNERSGARGEQTTAKRRTGSRFRRASEQHRINGLT